jgi:maleylacetoacetate isomerase
LSFKLYGYWRSSASWRVRWALQLKKIPFEYVPVNLVNGDNRSPVHLARNPLGAVPVLEIEPGVFLNESLPIIEWLEETFPQVPLFPSDPLQRARARSLCEIINSETAPLQTPRAQKKVSTDPKVGADFARHFICEGLKAYELLSQSWRGQWSIADTLTIADLFLVPQIYNAERWGILTSVDFPSLFKIYEQALATPECLSASPSKQIDAPKD